MPTNVLFMCPHGAGKSVAAAAYFTAAAVERGLEATVIVAGTDPDDVVMANVQQALEEQGFSPAWAPRLVTVVDTESADMIVSIGCDRAEIPTDKAVTEWDVPMLSDDLAGSLAAIRARAEALAAGMG